MSEPSFDVAEAHRWFAIEFNNQAWDLVEAADRSPEASEQMLHIAHAALVHWSEAGSELNRQRAECLLATAYLSAGLSEPAIRYGQSCVDRSLRSDNEQTAFDRATAHGCLAQALALAGRTAEAAEHFQAAAASAEGLTDAGEHEVYARLYPQP